MGKYAHLLKKKTKKQPRLLKDVKDPNASVKLADLAGKLDYDPTELILTPIQPYLEASEAGYDWAVGRPFRVRGPRWSPYKGQLVCIDDERALRRSGYLSVAIVTNLKAKAKAGNANMLRFNIGPTH